MINASGSDGQGGLHLEQHQSRLLSISAKAGFRSFQHILRMASFFRVCSREVPIAPYLRTTLSSSSITVADIQSGILCWSWIMRPSTAPNESSNCVPMPVLDSCICHHTHQTWIRSRSSSRSWKPSSSGSGRCSRRIQTKDLMSSWSGVRIMSEVERTMREVISDIPDGRLLICRYIPSRNVHLNGQMQKVPSLAPKGHATNRTIDDPGLKAFIMAAESHVRRTAAMSFASRNSILDTPCNFHL